MSKKTATLAHRLPGGGCVGGSTYKERDLVTHREYPKALGERLRNIRLQKGMSLQDVQGASEGRWKAAVVGAYERGDRNVTVARLSELAEFYGVPVSEILPGDDGPPAPGQVEGR